MKRCVFIQTTGQNIPQLKPHVLREMWQALGWKQDIENNIKAIRWNIHRMDKRGTVKGIDFWNFHLLNQGKNHKSWPQPPPIIQNPKWSPNW